MYRCLLVLFVIIGISVSMALPSFAQSSANPTLFEQTIRSLAQKYRICVLAEAAPLPPESSAEKSRQEDAVRKALEKTSSLPLKIREIAAIFDYNSDVVGMGAQKVVYVLSKQYTFAEELPYVSREEWNGFFEDADLLTKAVVPLPPHGVRGDLIPYCIHNLILSLDASQRTQLKEGSLTFASFNATQKAWMDKLLADSTFRSMGGGVAMTDSIVSVLDKSVIKYQFAAQAPQLGVLYPHKTLKRSIFQVLPYGMSQLKTQQNNLVPPGERQKSIAENAQRQAEAWQRCSALGDVIRDMNRRVVRGEGRLSFDKSGTCGDANNSGGCGKRQRATVRARSGEVVFVAHQSKEWGIHYRAEPASKGYYPG